MFENKKRLYIFGSAALSILVILVIYFSLMASGALNLIQNNLVISSGSSEKYYDGMVLKSESWKVESGKVKDRENIAIQFTGSQTEIGISENTFFIIITDENGNDVTTKYNITYVFGVLKVKSLPLKIATRSASKFYDGEPLNKNEYTHLSGELLEGHEMTVTVIGEITDVGKVDNDFIVVIKDNHNLDVTELYEINKECGTLEIYPRTITIQTANATKQYDGEALVKDEYTFNKDTLLYGHDILVTITGSQTEVGESKNYVTYEITDSNGRNVTSQYNMEEGLGVLKVDRRSITIITGSAEKIYDTTPLTCAEYEYDGLYENHDIEVTPNGTITNYSSISTPNSFTYAIYDKDGNNISTYYNVKGEEGTLKIIPYELIVTSDNLEVVYNGEEYIFDEYEFDESTPLFEGHYEVPSVPKGYSKPGSVQNVIYFKFYDSEENDISKNYSINNQLGLVIIAKAPIIIESSNVSKTYDGFPLVNGESEYEVTGLFEGHVPVYVNESTITNAGSEQNKFSVKILDENNENADVTLYYDIRYVYGNLIVNQKELIITTKDLTFTYNGNAVILHELYVAGENNIMDSGLIQADRIVEVSFLGSLTEFGQIDNACTLRVVDGAGISSNNYKIVSNFGTLKINKQVITIRTDDDSFEYNNGTKFKKESYTIVDGELHEGATILDKNYIEVSEVGTYYNTASIIVLNREGTSNVNYVVNLVHGNLTVYDDSSYPVNLTPKSLTLTATGNNDLFRHSDYYESNNNLNGFEYWSIQGYRYEAVVGTLIDIYLNGSSVNPLIIESITIYDANDRDVTRSFKIFMNDGTLKVSNYSVELTSDSATKVYDGYELTADSLDWNLSGETGEYVVFVTLSGQQTNVGTSKITYTLRVEDKYGMEATSEFLSEYTIVDKLGILKVTPAIVTVNVNNMVEEVGTDLESLTLSYTTDLNTGGAFVGYNLSVINKMTGTLTADSAELIKFECKIIKGAIDVTNNFEFVVNKPVITA